MLSFRHAWNIQRCLKQKLMLSLNVFILPYMHHAYQHLLMWEDKWVWSQEKVVEMSQEESSHQR